MNIAVKGRSLRAVLVLSLLAGAVPLSAQENDAYDTSRLVTVGGSITEIVFALGEEEHLVARDSTSLHPAAATELPDIGYIRQLSPEGVLSVDPSLIIALEGSGPPETVEVLANARVPMVMVPETYDGNGILEKIRIVGEILGVEDRAQALSRDVRSAIDEALAQAAAESDQKKVLFVLSLAGGRVMASGTGTAADAVITMAGGQNVITEFEGYRQLTEEAIIEAAPDVVLMMDRSGTHDARDDELFTHPAIAPTPAGRNHAAIYMDGAFLLNFGPRTAEAVRELAGHLQAVARER